jgi:hypothetical protein
LTIITNVLLTRKNTMDIPFRTYLPVARIVGSTVNIEGVAWICVRECTLIGSTVEENIPVILGVDENPIMNEDELILKSYFKTLPKPDKTYTENMLLAKYGRISAGELTKKHIKHIRKDDDTFVAICDDKSYVKFTAEREQWEDNLVLDDECLTIWDLKSFGILTDQEWDDHEDEGRRGRVRANNAVAERNFRQATRQIGVVRARKILDSLN